MNYRIESVACAAACSLLVLLTGCGGGGGGGGTAPPPAPPANRAPTLPASTVTTDEDTQATAQLAATDPDGNPLTFSLSTNAQHGTATVTAAGALTYLPSPNYSGADSIGVTVSDNVGGQATATVSVTVNPVNDLPALSTTQVAVDEDGVLNGQLAGSDMEGTAFTYVYIPAVQHGTLTLSASGSFTYTPAPNYSGADQMVVRLVESGGAFSQHTVNIAVSAVNDVPVASSDSLIVPAANGQPVALAVLANDSDVDGDVLTPEVMAQPRGGAVVVDTTTREMRFVPANGYVGPIDFTYRVSDGHARSGAAAVHAYVGEPESVVFLSDYTTPGVLELHLFDGLEVRRVSDDLPAGRTISTFGVSGDGQTLAYVLDGSGDERVYVKPLDGSAPAALRFTSTAKSVPAERRVSVLVNDDGSYLLVRDGWVGTLKQYYSVNAATGFSRRVAEAMPAVVDVRFAFFHPYVPRMILLQGQTSGSGPNDFVNRASSAFTADPADPRTLTQIGRTYAAGQCGSGEGIYVGNDTRYIYHGEFLCAANVINLIAYDRQNQSETYVVRQAAAPDRGVNGVAGPTLANERLCFAFYLPSTTSSSGPTRYYAMDTANPASALAVTAAFDNTTQCTMAADDRFMIFRRTPVGSVSQFAYTVDSVTPGAPILLAPAAEAASEQHAWQVAFGAPRVAIVYFDNDGVAGLAAGQVGRYYTMSANGAPDHFLFSDTFVQPSLGSSITGSSEDGAFILYARPRGAIAALELMSTHGLNLSIPLSRNSETLGVQAMRWIHRSARIN
ncbi:MAG TPA: cadherin-like domain-containing protein [Steroidobacteraceae bacterium]|nr:cadherin-like domain-containing protein [Steroidobacteraceae bacterium]